MTSPLPFTLSRAATTRTPIGSTNAPAVDRCKHEIGEPAQMDGIRCFRPGKSLHAKVLLSQPFHDFSNQNLHVPWEYQSSKPSESKDPGGLCVLDLGSTRLQRVDPSGTLTAQPSRRGLLPSL